MTDSRPDERPWNSMARLAPLGDGSVTYRIWVWISFVTIPFQTVWRGIVDPHGPGVLEHEALEMVAKRIEASRDLEDVSLACMIRVANLVGWSEAGIEEARRICLWHSNRVDQQLGRARGGRRARESLLQTDEGVRAYDSMETAQFAAFALRELDGAAAMGCLRRYH